jgi:hypothetical protein
VDKTRHRHLIELARQFVTLHPKPAGGGTPPKLAPEAGFATGGGGEFPVKGLESDLDRLGSTTILKQKSPD